MSFMPSVVAAAGGFEEWETLMTAELSAGTAIGYSRGTPFGSINPDAPVFDEWELWVGTDVPGISYTMQFTAPDVPNTDNTFAKINVQGTFAEGGATNFDLQRADAVYQVNFNGHTVWTWSVGEALLHSMQDGFNYNWKWFRLVG